MIHPVDGGGTTAKLQGFGVVADAQIYMVALYGAAGVLSPVSAQSRTVTVVHQHIGPQRDYGRIHRYCSIRRGRVPLAVMP